MSVQTRFELEGHLLDFGDIHRDTILSNEWRVLIPDDWFYHLFGEGELFSLNTKRLMDESKRFFEKLQHELYVDNQGAVILECYS